MKLDKSALSFGSVFLFSSTLLVNCGAPPDDPIYSTGGTSGGSGGTASTGGTGAVGSGGATTTGGGGGVEKMSSSCAAPPTPFEVVADESTNMDLDSHLSFSEGQVYKGSSLDLAFDWSAVTTDFFKQPVTPTEIVVVALVGWTVAPTEVARLINEDVADIESYVAFPPIGLAQVNGVTSATLRDFVDLGGGHIDEGYLLSYLDPAEQLTYTLILQDQSDIGIGARMIHAFTLDGAATETNIVLTDASTTLTATATLGMPTQVPAASNQLSIDWTSSIDERSFGGEFKDNGITEVIIGQYDAGVDLQAMDGILALESSAKNLYRGAAVFSPHDASTLMDANGAPFPGVDATDQWFLALVCNTCSNPSPWYLTKLEPCP